MTLENYKPFESHLCGNDLAALEKAKSRIHFALNNFELSWRDRERLQEMLLAGSLLEMESTRAAWAEMLALLPTKLTCES